MQKTKVHIISFDVPYPADYGGVIDVFYKLKALHDAGVDIYLHCFVYGRAHAASLEKYCAKVFYYKRKTGLAGISLSMPYMVYSRRDAALLPNLLSIDAPIIFEGVHCAYLLHHPALKNRKKILRNHNIEQDYFALLAKRETSLFKKLYYNIESALLRSFETKLQPADALLPISLQDTAYFKALYPEKQVQLIQGFHPYNEITSLPGKGSFCLYHGNLGHPENIEAALFLINEVFSELKIPLVLAGRNPDEKIIAAVKKHQHISIVANPDEADMNKLIANAQIQVLPSFQASGLKLKLLYALFGGKFVIANQQILQGSGLEDLCSIAENATAFKQKILLLMSAEFSDMEIEKRKQILLQDYSNKLNALKLKGILQE